MRIAHKKGIQKRFRSWKKWLEITINIIAHAIIMFYKIIQYFRLIKISRGRNFSIKKPKTTEEVHLLFLIYKSQQSMLIENHFQSMLEFLFLQSDDAYREKNA